MWLQERLRNRRTEDEPAASTHLPLKGGGQKQKNFTQQRVTMIDLLESSKWNFLTAAEVLNKQINVTLKKNHLTMCKLGFKGFLV